MLKKFIELIYKLSFIVLLITNTNCFASSQEPSPKFSKEIKKRKEPAIVTEDNYSKLNSNGTSFQQVRIQLGRKIIVDDGVRIEFRSVLEDSRCPEGVLCDSVGQGKIAVIAYHTSLRVRAKDKVLSIEGSKKIVQENEGNSLDIRDAKKERQWKVVFFSLDPYPSQSIPVNKSPNYFATFAIFRTR